MVKQKTRIDSWDDVVTALDDGRLVFKAGESWESEYDETLCDMTAELDGRRVALWAQMASGDSNLHAVGELQVAFRLGSWRQRFHERIVEACIEALPAGMRDDD